MNLKISEKLKYYRKQKGNTQEQLASYIGISVQAVSKWERAEGYPDITLLPVIASYYDITVDELLGCSEADKNKKIQQYNDEYKANSSQGKIEDNISLMRQALREFPNNLDFKAKLLHSLFFSSNDDYLDECIELGEEILEKSTDDQQRYAAIQALAYSYNRKGLSDKAVEYANRLPNFFCTRNSILKAILKGEELLKLTQEEIINAISIIDSAVTWMLRAKDYTPEDKIFAYYTVVKLYDLFLYDGNYGYEHSALHILWMNIAQEYAMLKNEEKTLEALKKAYYHAKCMDELEDGQYTSIFASTGTYSKKNMSRNFSYSYVDWLKNFMGNKIFDFVREQLNFE